MEEIVELSLLNEKLAVYYQDRKADKMCILNKISFCEARQKVLLLTSSTFVYMSCCVISDYIKGCCCCCCHNPQITKESLGRLFWCPLQKKKILIHFANMS